MLLTVRQAATLLRATERQVYRWVDEGKIPFQRLHHQVRFNPTELLEWAMSRQLRVSLLPFLERLDPEEHALDLAQALRAGGAHASVPATTRELALRELLTRTPLPQNADREFIIEVLLARPTSGFTWRSDGIAIPNVRQPIVVAGAPATLCVAYLSEPLALGTKEAQRAHTLILVVSPTVRTHLQLVARLTRGLHDPCLHAALVRQAPTEELAAEAERVEASYSIVPEPLSTGWP